MRSIVSALASLVLSWSFLISPSAAADNFKQPDPFGCGPAAAANCVQGGIKFYKGVCKKLPNPDVVREPRDDWDNGAGGVTRWELCAALNAYDDDHEWKIKDKGTVEDLKEICEGDGRAIVLLPGVGGGAGHFVTACTVVGDRKPVVIVVDPADGKSKRKVLVEPIVIIYPK